MANLHTSFYANTLWQYGLQAVKYLFPLITTPYLTRVLEPSGYAVYAYVLSFMSFAQVFVDFGFNLSGTKQIAAARSVEECSRIVGKLTQARLLLSAAAFAAVLAIASFLPLTQGNLLYTMLSLVAVCGRAFAPDFLFQGKERMGSLTPRYFVSKGVSTALTFVLVRSSADLLWVPVLDILASAIALAWSFAAARRLFGTGVALAPWGECLRELRTSALYCLSNMSSAVFTGFTTLLIGAVLADQAQVSYWSLAMTAVAAVQSLYTPITNSLYPHMIVRGDFGFARKVALIALPVVLAGTVAFAFLAPVIVMVLGGEAYLAGADVLAMVSPVLFFSFFGMYFGWPVLGAMGKVAELTRTTVVSALASIAALVALALFGAVSLASVCVVRVATEALMCGLRLLECARGRKALGVNRDTASSHG